MLLACANRSQVGWTHGSRRCAASLAFGLVPHGRLRSTGISRCSPLANEHYVGGVRINRTGILAAGERANCGPRWSQPRETTGASSRRRRRCRCRQVRPLSHSRPISRVPAGGNVLTGSAGRPLSREPISSATPCLMRLWTSHEATIFLAAGARISLSQLPEQLVGACRRRDHFADEFKRGSQHSDVHQAWIINRSTNNGMDPQ